MDSLDTCVKLEMTKTGAVPGQWRISYLKWTHFFELLILVVDWCTLDFGSVVSRCCGRCGVAFSPVRIRRTVVSLPWVLPHVPCHTCIPFMRDHYEFVLYLEYMDCPLVTSGFGETTVLYMLVGIKMC